MVILLDYSKNFKLKNIIIRTVSFVIYFIAAGFISTLCVHLLAPLFALFFKQRPETADIILYIISFVVMLCAISFFSGREGYTDTRKLRFTYIKTIISYISSGIIFYFIILSLVIMEKDPKYTEIFIKIEKYFFAPFFIPAETLEIFNNFIFNRWVNLFFSILFCIASEIGFYKIGRNVWIKRQKKKIEKLRKSS